MKTVVGIFGSRRQAESAARGLSEEGFDRKEVSLVAKHDGTPEDKGQTGGGRDPGDGEIQMQGTDEVSDGISTGTLLGGVGGLLLGVGALTIPGLGPIVAAGPIAAALTGAVTGGVAGGLLDLGVPNEHGRRYEETGQGWQDSGGRPDQGRQD
jgi:hypothetical protein